MDILHIGKSDLLGFVQSLIDRGDRQVVGVTPKGARFAFDQLEKAADLCLDYDETILPPKKYLLPAKDVLLTFKPGDASSYREERDTSPRVIIGVHPGDLAAIALLDKAFAEGESDGHYLTRRSNTLLIGIHPTQAFRHRFTRSMINGEEYRAADLMLTDLGDGSYAVEIVTDNGRRLFSTAKAAPGSATVASRMEQRKRFVDDGLSMSIGRDELPAFLAGRERDPVIEKRAEKCFSCGSCVLVCPTCYCFDVRDEVALSLDKGERYRVWDGCTIENFALAAGGHNFRKQAAGRLSHRIFRKCAYLKERFGMMGCVGCGRCGQACTAEIASPAETINEMQGKGA